MWSKVLILQCSLMLFFECNGNADETFQINMMKNECEAAKVFAGSVYYHNIITGGLNKTVVFLHSNNGSLYSYTTEYLQVKIIMEMSEQLLKFLTKEPLPTSGFANRDNVYNYWKRIKRQCGTVLNNYYNQVAFKLWHTIKYKSKLIRGMGGGLYFENKTRKEILEHWYAEDKHINSCMNYTVSQIRSFFRENLMSWSGGPYRVYAIAQFDMPVN